MSANEFKAKDGTTYNFDGGRVLVYVTDVSYWLDSDTAAFAAGWIDGCQGDAACSDRTAQDQYFDNFFDGDDDGEFHRHVANLLEMQTEQA